MLRHAKFLITALFLFCTLFLLATAISADYTTDGDDTTSVDYIIMNAAQIKAATGTKGEVIVEENDWAVAKYTAAESWYTAGRLNITPANSGAGFAATGENSLFVFPYYVVHYKTTSNALTNDTTDLLSSTLNKWGGSEQIVKSTGYTYKTISRDTFVNGSDGTSTLLDNTRASQMISLKMFQTADVDGYIYIESIAAFRTEAQAEDFKANYTPKIIDYTTDGNDETAVDYIVMSPAQIKAASAGEKGELTVDEDGYAVAKYTAAETWYSAGSSGQLQIYPANSDAGFAATGENSLLDFPYYVIRYKTTATGVVSDSTNLIGSNITKWAGKEQLSLATDYTYKTLKRDTFINGSDSTTNPLDNTKTNQAIGLKIFSTAETDGCIYIESIAVFRTEDQAEAFKLLHTPSYPETEDYATDMDPNTEVDYIIMHEDDVKLATGDKGVFFTEADGNRVVKYTAAESYYTSGSTGQLSIVPANSDAGFAESGENSLLDFPYYVVRYKTTGTGARGSDTTLLVGGTVTKWLGSEQIVSMTEYGYKTIKRDTFINGSDGTTNLLNNTKTNQAIGLKLFTAADVDGAMYIDLIAAFRTEKQAELFIEDYVPESTVDTSNQLVLIADTLNGTVSTTAFEKSYVYDESAGKAYVKFTATEDGTHKDGSQFIFNFTTGGETAGYTVKEYPIVKISYKSNIANTGAGIDTCYGLTYSGTNTRVWGYVPSYVHDETFNSIIFDASSVFSGGENITDYSFDNVDADSVCNYLTLKPWYNGAIVTGEYFAVEYVGFFKTAADAEAYEYEIDKTLLGIKTECDVYKLAIDETLQAVYTPTPSYADLSSVTFSTSDENVATVSDTGLITAAGLGKAVITIADTVGGVSAEITVVVQDDAPIDWYAADSEEGEAIVVNVIGDSISYGAGVTDRLTDTYHGIWASDFKMTVNNWSRGGSSITGDYKDGGTFIESFNPRMERMIAGTSNSYDVINTTDDPDMIVIYGGTNDYNGNWLAFGEVGDTTRSTYCGAISELIHLAWKNYPDAKLVFFTPIKRTDYSLTNDQDNTGTRKYELDAYVDAMKAVCEYYDVDCIDLYNNEQANLTGLRTTYIKDGVHMTDAGHEIFAKVAIEEMEKAGVITTHGYTAEPAPTYTLDADRDLTANSHIYDAATLDTLTTYAAGTLLDRQRMTKHTLTDEGYIRFSAETLTSKLAPTVTVDFSQLDFAITDYPYMSVIYKTNSTATNIDAQLRGADNHVSTVDTLPALTSDEKAAFTVNVMDYESEDIVLTGDTINSDLYMTMSFFESTYDMTSDSYVDIEAIAFFKNEADATKYADNLGVPTASITVNAIGNGSFSVDGADAVKTYTADIAEGEKITLTAIADTTYVVDGWYEVTDSKNIVLAKGENTYELTVSDDAVIEAGTTVNLYVDAKGVIIATGEEPAVPDRIGYTGGKWLLDEESASVNVYVADYVKSDETYTLTVNYADGTSEEKTFKYNQLITLTATAEDTQWVLNGTVVSNASEYSFYITFIEDVVIEEVAAGEAEAVLAVTNTVYDAGSKKIKFMVSFELVEGMEFVETGVLLSNNADIADTMEIGDEGVITGKSSAANASSGNFIINKGGVSVGDTWYGRAYLICKQDGETTVLYADTVSHTAE